MEDVKKLEDILIEINSGGFDSEYLNLIDLIKLKAHLDLHIDKRTFELCIEENNKGGQKVVS